MIKAQWSRYRLQFRFLAKTSREEMTAKDTYFVRTYDDCRPDIVGLGECALFRGLSADDVPDFENRLSEACRHPLEPLPEMSAIRFGFETAMADLRNGGHRTIFESQWQNGRKQIAINGLIWMGDKATMVRRVEEKLSQGFKILKLKVGGIAFDDELDIIKTIRRRFGRNDLEIRLDANGNFKAENVDKRLEELSKYDIHSIEQPVAAGQHALMKRICASSPIDIALDEELIGCRSDVDMDDMLSEIKPQYIILKPSLCGGFERADHWIATAMKYGIGWWATSALESNIGLNAIAQWVSTKDNDMAQGLGTGELYDNNIASPLAMSDARLIYRQNEKWIIPDLPWQV